jgi:hypothetical protein
MIGDRIVLQERAGDGQGVVATDDKYQGCLEEV